MKKIRKNDEVIIIAGKYKGQTGTVLNMVGEEKVIVQNINLAKKHVKPNPNKGETGGIVEREMPIHISNLALFNQATGKADRVGFRVLEDGKKVRYFKSNNEVVDI